LVKHDGAVIIHGVEIISGISHVRYVTLKRKSEKKIAE